MPREKNTHIARARCHPLRRNWHHETLHEERPPWGPDPSRRDETRRDRAARYSNNQNLAAQTQHRRAIVVSSRSFTKRRRNCSAAGSDERGTSSYEAGLDGASSTVSGKRISRSAGRVHLAQTTGRTRRPAADLWAFEWRETARREEPSFEDPARLEPELVDRAFH